MALLPKPLRDVALAPVEARGSADGGDFMGRSRPFCVMQEQTLK